MKVICEFIEKNPSRTADKGWSVPDIGEVRNPNWKKINL